MGKKSLTREEVEAERLERTASRKRKALEELEKLRAIEEMDGGDPAAEASALPGQSRIEQIISDVEGEGHFDVFRLETGGKQVKLASYDIATYPESMENLVKAKGGGQYLMIFRHGDGSYAGRVSRTFDVGTYGDGAPAAPAASAFDPMRMVDFMRESDARHRQELESMRLENQRMMIEQQKMMADMFKSTQSGFSRDLTGLAAIAKLFKEDGGQRNDPIESLLSLRDLMDELKGDVRGESPIVGILSKFADTFSKAMTPRRESAPRISQEVRATAPPPAPAPRVEAPGNNGGKYLDMSDYIESFRAAILSGQDPKAAAEYTYKIAESEEQRKNLSLLLRFGDWDKLKAHEFLRDHVEWLDSFKQRMEEFFNVPSPAP